MSPNFSIVMQGTGDEDKMWCAGWVGGWEEGAQALVAYGRECFVWLMVVI